MTTKDVFVLIRNDVALRVRKDGTILFKKLLVSIVLYLLPVLTVWVLLQFAENLRVANSGVRQVPGNIEVVDN